MNALVQQTSFAQRAAVSTKAARPAGRARAMVCRASSEPEQARRAVLGGMLAGVAALTLSAQSAMAIDIRDDRKAKDTGFELIYEARDVDLPQNVRDGFTQARTSLEATKARLSESEKRIDADLEPFIRKNYWTEAREQLRRQVGTLRFDINAFAETKVKEEKKAALALKKDFLVKVEALDFALRSKDEAKALKALEETKVSLDAVLAVL